MIDIRKLKELVRLMKENDLSELDLRDSEEQVTLRRQNESAPPQLVTHQPISMPAIPQPPPASTSSAPAAQEATADADVAGLHRIESPMVGTFYTAPNPDTPAFVNVGDSVTADKVICIIEAMKIFNEIKAECSGTIHKILASSGEAVEFGQPLFLVKPA